MAFEIHGPKGQVLLEDEHQLLFQLGAKLGERTPHLDRLSSELYGHGQIGLREVSGAAIITASGLRRTSRGRSKLQVSGGAVSAMSRWSIGVSA